MNIIPLNADLVKGSHGRIPEDASDYPVFITNNRRSINKELYKSTDVYKLLAKQIIG